MKVLFTADIHIRIGQKNIPREWAIKQFECVFSEINRIYTENNCELEVHGGDIFDKVPTMEELCLYIQYLWQNPTRPRVIYDGNHEATKKGDTFLKYIVPMVPKDTEVFTEPYHLCSKIQIIPYTNIHKLKDIPKTANILFTHVRGNIPPHVKAEVDLNLFDKWEVVFAGDLHAHSNTQRNIIYPGSPRTVTFHRTNVQLGVITFDVDNPSDWKWHKIKVPQLIRKTIDNPKDMIKTDFDHTIYELTGNLMELSKIDKDSDLLDKKIIQREQPASLDLTNMTINEELEKYLTDIVKLQKQEVKEVMEIFNAYT